VPLASVVSLFLFFFFFSSRRRHTRFSRDWSSDVCSSDLQVVADRKAGTLRAERQQRGEDRDADHVGPEDAGEAGPLAAGLGAGECLLEDVGIVRAAANEEDQEGGQNADPERDAPADLRRQCGSKWASDQRGDARADRGAAVQRAQGLAAVL